LLFLALTITGLLFVWVVVLGIQSLMDEKEVCVSLILLITILTLGNSFLANEVTFPGRAGKNVDLVVQAVTVTSCPAEIQRNKAMRRSFNQLRNELVERCTLQNIQDIKDLTKESVQAIYLDPVTSLANTIYSDLIRDEEVTCLATAKRMDELCPGHLGM